MAQAPGDPDDTGSLTSHQGCVCSSKPESYRLAETDLSPWCPVSESPGNLVPALSNLFLSPLCLRLLILHHHPPDHPDVDDLEQRVLQALRDAGSPVKSVQLAKDCQVPKKELNQVLSRMKKESKVSLEGQATWGLGEGGTGEVVPAEPAPRSRERPQQNAVALPEEPGPHLTKEQEEIYRILEALGPCKALTISQKLGKKTAKEVNPDLYAMRRKHLLDFDEKSSTWATYQPDLRGRNPAPAVIYQNNPINMICQNGPNSHISIANSESTQIGHGNVIMRQTASGENGSMAPLHLPPAGPAGPFPAAAWGPQDISLEKFVLRRVQMGHGNEMNLNGAPTKDPAACSPSGSPPGAVHSDQGAQAKSSPALVTQRQAGGKEQQGGGDAQRRGSRKEEAISATTDGPGASFEIRMPKPGPFSEEEVAQRVCVSSCFLEDTAIGNSSRMAVSSETAGPGGAARPEDGRRDRGEPGNDAGAEPGSQFPHDRDQASPGNGDVLTIISHLEAVTLESGDPQTAEDSGRVDRTPDTDSQGQVESRTNSQALSGRAGQHQ